jgi:hypothetical protein
LTAFVFVQYQRLESELFPTSSPQVLKGRMQYTSSIFNQQPGFDSDCVVKGSGSRLSTDWYFTTQADAKNLQR